MHGLNIMNHRAGNGREKEVYRGTEMYGPVQSPVCATHHAGPVNHQPLHQSAGLRKLRHTQVQRKQVRAATPQIHAEDGPLSIELRCRIAFHRSRLDARIECFVNVRL